MGVRWFLGALALAAVSPGCGFVNKHMLGKGQGTPDNGLWRIVDPDLDERFSARDLNSVVNSGLFLLPTGLSRPASCDDAAERLRTIMLSQLRSSFDDQLRYAHQWRNGGFSGPVVADTAASAAPEKVSAAPQDHTTTNNQIAGVEEGDIIKNTGTHMFVARGDRIFVVKSWPARELNHLATLVVGGAIIEMVLVNKSTLVVASQPQVVLPGEPSQPIGSHPGAEPVPVGMAGQAEPFLSTAGRPWPGSSVATTLLTIIDVSHPNAPRITDQHHLFGGFQQFRHVDGAVRAVLSHTLNFPEGVPTHASSPSNDGAELQEQLQGLYDRAKQTLASMSPQELLLRSLGHKHGIRFVQAPELKPVVAPGDSSCSNLHLPDLPPNTLSMTSVVTLNVTTKTLHSEHILAGAQSVYASKDALYLAAQLWDGWSGFSETLPPAGTPMNWTTIHQFDTRQADRATYVASGTVAGSLLNQFSMDEHEGILRVALTESRFAEASNIPSQRWPLGSVSHITTLKLESGDATHGARLRPFGRTPDLAPDERIFSARFDDDRAFLVTFRQVDPLFAIDLQDPANPTVLGELKIPGFSNYMQVIDNDTLLTIGNDADAITGMTRGLKLSLFDVSDMTAPRELHSLLLNNSEWSEANHNHKAFTYYARAGHLAIPLTGSICRGDSCDYTSRLSLYSISRERGITPAGALDLSDLAATLPADRVTRDTSGQQHSCYPADPSVRRSVFADDFVYAIGGLGIKVAAIDRLSDAVGAVVFPNVDCQPDQDLGGHR